MRSVFKLIIVVFIVFSAPLHAQESDSSDDHQAVIPGNSMSVEAVADVPLAVSQEIKDLEVRANAGDAEAQAQLGDIYAKGEDVVQDSALAVKWWEKAAQGGHAPSQYNLGVKYARGDGVTRSDKQALQWWERAAKAGHKYAQYNVALKYLRGEGTLKNTQRAYAWFVCAAAQGVGEAQRAVAHLNENLDADTLVDAKDLSQTYRLVYVPTKI